MARTARTHSDSGVYHVILRGVNKQQIFECTEDYQRFLNILRTLTVQEQDESGHRSKPNCVVYAYCLMGNHVHHLIKESSETLAQIMKRISSSYVYYYNHKYGRIGHLFQERFKSQPVGDWDYFLTLLRYIHQNPLKPHLVSSLLPPLLSFSNCHDRSRSTISGKPMKKELGLAHCPALQA